MRTGTLMAMLTAIPLLAACGAGGTDDEEGGAAGGNTGGSGADGAGADGAGADGAGGDGSGGPGSGTTKQIGDCTLNQVEIAGNGTVPSIAATDDGFAIAYRSDSAVKLAILDDAGNVESDTALAETQTAGLISVVRADGSLHVNWADGGTVLTREFSLQGDPLFGEEVVAETGSLEPRPHGTALSDGTLGLVWMDQPEVHGVLLDEGAEVGSATATGWFPTLVNGEGGLGLAWSEGGETGPVAFGLFSASMGEFSTVPNSQALIKSGVSSGGDFYVAWEDVSGGEERVDMARFDSGGGFMERIQVSPGEASANWPALTTTDEGVAVAYYQFRDGPPTVYVQHYDTAMVPSEEELEVEIDAKYPSLGFARGTLMIAYRIDTPGTLNATSITCE